jgi:protein SCO1/2
MHEQARVASDTVPPMQRTQSLEPRPLVSARGRIVITAVVAVLVVSGMILWSRPHEFAGTPVDPPGPAPDLSSLTLHTGEVADIERFAGNVILVTFAYTRCPDVCPGMLSLLAGAMDALGDRTADVEVIVVGIDPERDGPRDLARYVTAFDPRFLAAVGTERDVRAVAGDYGVFLRRIPTADGYVFEQTATVAAIGPNGDLRLFYSPDVDPDALAEDVRELLP